MSEHKKPFPFRPEDSALCPIHDDGSLHIGRAVRHIKNEGWPDSQTLDPRPGAGYEGSELRVALFTAATPVSEEVIARASTSREERPPFGLIRSLPYDSSSNSYPVIPVTEFGDNPFLELRLAFRDTLDLSWKQLHELYLDHQLPSTRQSYYEAFARLAHYRKGSSEDLIHSGIATGTRTTTNILGVVEPIVKRNLPRELQTPEIFEEIAISSYPLITMLTGDDGNVTVKILNELEDNKGGPGKLAPFNPNYLRISEAGGLEVTSEFIDRFKQTNKVWLGERKAVGCPVMHSSALLNLWNWELEIARAIWAEQLQDPNLLVYTKSGNE